MSNPTELPDLDRLERCATKGAHVSRDEFLALIALARRAAPVSAPVAGDAPPIKTWKERAAEHKTKWHGLPPPPDDFMRAEIADLRAALANQPAPTAAPEQVATLRGIEAALLHARNPMGDRLTHINTALNATQTLLALQPSEAAPLVYQVRFTGTDEWQEVWPDNYELHIGEKRVLRIAAPSLPAARSAKSGAQAGEYCDHPAFLKIMGDILTPKGMAKFNADEDVNLNREFASEIFRAGLAAQHQGAPAAGGELRKVLAKLRDQILNDQGVSLGDIDAVAALAHQPAQEQASTKPELEVWYGAMPESNGKSNFTAILKRKGAGPFDTCHITIDRSEYPDRVRYEADRVRWIIGELADEPWILDYDAGKHSGYVAASPVVRAQSEESADAVVEANRKMLLDRSRAGIAKYGVTLAGAGLNREQLIQHALEESLDLANYLQALLKGSAIRAAQEGEST